MQQVIDKAMNNLETVVCPAIQNMNFDVAEMAPRSAGAAAMHGLGCGFIAGMQYALSICESGRAINDEDSMRAFLLDVAELMVETSGSGSCATKRNK